MPTASQEISRGAHGRAGISGRDPGGGHRLTRRLDDLEIFEEDGNLLAVRDAETARRLRAACPALERARRAYRAMKALLGGA